MKSGLLKLFSIVFATVFIIGSLTACGAESMKYADNAMIEENYTSDEVISESIADSTADTVSDNRKIIENIGLSIQTKEFDKLMDSLEKEITKLGGYIENSSVYGRQYDSDDTRSADMTVRIPSDKSGNFTEFISENSVVVNKSISTEDVTLTYVDMESRVEVLEAEKVSLENLLKNATSMTDIIAVREQLTEVISSIESYKSQLRTYDNLVSYSTVTIEIYEVERTAVVEKQNIWQKIGTNLKNNFSNVWNGFLDLFVFFVSSIPYLIPLFIIGAVILVIFLIRRKKQKKNIKTN